MYYAVPLSLYYAKVLQKYVFSADCQPIWSLFFTSTKKKTTKNGQTVATSKKMHYLYNSLATSIAPI